MDIASLVLAIDSTQADKAEKSLSKLEAASKKVEKSTSDLKTSTGNAWATMNTFSAAEDAAADKAWALANGYKEANGQLVKIADVSEVSGSAMSKLGLNTQYARREMMQLGKDALTGDFGRMPNAFASLATHSNILPAMISPIGLAIAGVTAAAAIGGYAWYNWGESAKEAAKKAATEYEDLQKKVRASARQTDEERLQQIQYEMQGAKASAKFYADIVNKGPSKSSQSQVENASRMAGQYRELLGNLDRQAAEIEAKLTSAQDKSNAARQKALDDQRKIEEGNAKEYAHAQAMQRVVEIEISSGTQLTESQKKLIELQILVESGNYKIADSELARQVANLATSASAEMTFADYIKKQKEMEKAAKDAAKNSNKAWETFADNTQRTMSDVFFNGMTGKYTDIEQAFAEMLKRMLANAAAARLSEAMFGNNGKTGSASNGWIGSILGALSFDGGGSTGSGTRSGGIDGKGGFPAILHPNETVIDHTKGQSAGVGITIVDQTTINIDSRADRQQVMTDVSKLIEGKQAQLVDRLQRQGALA